MKDRFVIDLNIAHSAQTLKDDHGNDSTESARALVELIDKCHSIVACIEMHRAYSDLADKLALSGEQQGPDIFGLASAAWSVEGKWRWVPEPPEVNGEEVVKDDDRVLVRLAIQHSAHIITTDTPLRNAINASGLLEQHGLRVMTPGEALERIMAQ